MITTLFSRTLENPATPLADFDQWEDWWEENGFLSGLRASSGVRVNRVTALTYAAIFKGVNLISTTAAKLPLFVYRRESSGNGEGKERDPAHSAYPLLRHEANERMTAFTFRQILTAQAIMHGNGYGHIGRSGDGRPAELLWLNPERTTAGLANGKLFYSTEIDGQPRILNPHNVLHIKGLGFDGLSGYSVIRLASESVGLGLATRKYGSVFFKNSARPSVVIEVPEALSETAWKRLQESWGKHQGIENQHRVKILEEGAQLKPFSISAADAQLLETRKFEIREIANWLGIPPHKLGDDTRTSFNSLEQENQSFLDEALDGWLVQWETEARKKLLSENEKRDDTHLIEHVRQALVRADVAKRSAFYRTALGGRPWMTLNEVRARENLNPVDGGDEILDPLNMAPAGGGGGNGGNGDDGNRAALRRLLIDAFGRIFKRISVHAEKAARKGLPAFDDWMQSFADEHRQACLAILGPVLELLGFDEAAAVREVGEQLASLWMQFSFLDPAEEGFDLQREVQSVLAELDPAQHAEGILEEKSE